MKNYKLSTQILMTVAVGVSTCINSLGAKASPPLADRVIPSQPSCQGPLHDAVTGLTAFNHSRASLMSNIEFNVATAASNRSLLDQWLSANTDPYDGRVKTTANNEQTQLTGLMESVQQQNLALGKIVNRIQNCLYTEQVSPQVEPVTSSEVYYFVPDGSIVSSQDNSASHLMVLNSVQPTQPGTHFMATRGWWENPGQSIAMTVTLRDSNVWKKDGILRFVGNAVDTSACLDAVAAVTGNSPRIGNSRKSSGIVIPTLYCSPAGDRLSRMVVVFAKPA